MGHSLLPLDLYKSEPLVPGKPKSDAPNSALYALSQVVCAMAEGRAYLNLGYKFTVLLELFEANLESMIERENRVNLVKIVWGMSLLKQLSTDLLHKIGELMIKSKIMDKLLLKDVQVLLEACFYTYGDEVYKPFLVEALTKRAIELLPQIDHMEGVQPSKLMTQLFKCYRNLRVPDNLIFDKMTDKLFDMIAKGRADNILLLFAFSKLS